MTLKEKQLKVDCIWLKKGGNATIEDLNSYNAKHELNYFNNISKNLKNHFNAPPSSGGFV
jgi:hypothetical protein